MNYESLIGWVASQMQVWLPVSISIVSLLVSLSIYAKDRSILRTRAVLYEQDDGPKSWIGVRITNHGRRVAKLRGIIFRDQDSWECLTGFAEMTALEEGDALEFSIEPSACEWPEFPDGVGVACHVGVCDNLGRRYWIPRGASLLADLKSLAKITTPPRNYRCYVRAIAMRMRGRGFV